MSTLRLLLLLAWAAAFSFAQNPVPTCPDGSVKFVFATTVDGIFIPNPFGGPPTAVTIGTYGGGPDLCTAGDPLPAPGVPAHVFKFRSGPIASTGNVGTGTNRWGPGGFVVAYTTGENHLQQCTTATPCAYKGKWDYLTLQQIVLPDGSSVWQFQGAAHGTYTDPMVGTMKNVLATFTTNSLDFSCSQLGCHGEAWSGGTLTIATGGPQ